MALAKLLFNRRGQAFVEALSVLLISLPLLFGVLIFLLNATTILALDTFLEAHLICVASEKTNCRALTFSKLERLYLKNIMLQENKNAPRFSVTFKGQTRFGYDITKKRDLELDLRVR